MFYLFKPKKTTKVFLRFFHARNQHLNPSEHQTRLTRIFSYSGRTLLEMLVVLAVIGVLSVAALVGFTYAMNKHRANETIHDVMLRGTNVPMIDDLYPSRPNGYEWRFAGLPGNGSRGTYYPMTTKKDAGSSYYVEVTGVTYRVCELILKMNPTDIDQIVVNNSVYTGDSDICGTTDGLAMKFCFGSDGTICDGTYQGDPDDKPHPPATHPCEIDPDSAACLQLCQNSPNPTCCQTPNAPACACDERPVCETCQQYTFDKTGCAIGCEDVADYACCLYPDDPCCINPDSCRCEACSGTCPDGYEPTDDTDANGCPVCCQKKCDAGEVKCLGACCADGTVCTADGSCCPETQFVCGDTCCEQGSLCVDGSCCPAEQSCGETCCADGLTCVDGACEEGPCPNGTLVSLTGVDNFYCCDDPKQARNQFKGDDIDKWDDTVIYEGKAYPWFRVCCEPGQAVYLTLSGTIGCCDSDEVKVSGWVEEDYCCAANQRPYWNGGSIQCCAQPNHPSLITGHSLNQTDNADGKKAYGCCPQGESAYQASDGVKCCGGDKNIVKAFENTATGEVNYQCCKGEAYTMYTDGTQIYYSCCQGTVFTDYRGQETCCWDSDELDYEQGYYTVTKGKVVDVFQSGQDKVGQTCCTYYTQSEEWTDEGVEMKDVFYNPSGAVMDGYAKCCNGGIWKDKGGTYGCCEDPKPQATWTHETTYNRYCCAEGETAADSESQYQNSGCCTDGRVALEAQPGGYGEVHSYCCYPGEGVFNNAEQQKFQNRWGGCCPVGMEVLYHREVHNNWDPDALAYYTITQDDTLTGFSNCCVPGTTYNQCCQLDSPNLKHNSLGDFVSCCPDGQTAYCEVFDKDGKCVHYQCSSTPCRPYCDRYDHYTGKCVVGGCQTDADCTFAVVNNRTGCCPSGTTPYCSGLKWMDNGSGGVTPGDCYGDVSCCDGTVYRNTTWSEDQQFCCPKGSFVYSAPYSNKFNEDGTCDMTGAVTKNICCPDGSEPFFKQGTGGCGPSCG